MPQDQKEPSRDLPGPGNDPVEQVVGCVWNSTSSPAADAAGTHLVTGDLSLAGTLPLIDTTVSVPRRTVCGDLQVNIEESLSDPSTPTDDLCTRSSDVNTVDLHRLDNNPSPDSSPTSTVGAAESSTSVSNKR